MTVPQVAHALHMSKPHTYRLVASGELPAIRLGDGQRRGQMIRIDPQVVVEFLLARGMSGGTPR